MTRRHDVDWLRTLAIGFLIVFHVLLTFQSWATEIGFPQNEELLEGLVPFISMLTVWRIPLLFMISGMGVRFAMERRDWKGLLKERATRILLPYLAGMLVFAPVLFFGLSALGWTPEQIPTFGHLWFLLNIFLYVVWLIGILIYLKDHPQNPLLRFFTRVIRMPLGLFLFAVPVMVEVLVFRPEYFSVYVDSVHGWLIGLICFFWGFVFISAQESFWPAVRKTRWPALLLAAGLFLVRWFVFGWGEEHQWLTALESMSWMLAMIGFGSVYLNRPSRILTYLSKAAYPVYIVHLPVQYTLCYFLLPDPMGAWSKLAVLLAGTFGVSLLLYELVLKRLKWIRPLFGMKLSQV